MTEPLHGLTQDQLNRIGRAIRRVESVPTGQPLGGGPHRPTLADRLIGLNEGGTTAPVGAIGYVTDADDDYLYFQEAEGAESSPLIVVVEAIEATDSDGEGAGEVATHGKVQVLVQGYEDLATGDRIGASDSSAATWYGEANPQGPLVFIESVAEQPEGLPAGVGLVWALFVGGGGGGSDLFLWIITTVDSNGGVYVKKIDEDGEPIGDEEGPYLDGGTLTGGDALEVDDYAHILLTADGQRVLCPISGASEPFLYKVTDDDPLQAKRVDSDGEVTGDAEEFIDGSEW